MIKDSLKDIGNSARGLFKNPLGLLLLCALYLATLVCVYVFFATGQATAWQLIVSALTAVAAPVLFFLLQSAVANFAQPDTGIAALLRRTLRDFLKVLLLGIPLIALAVGIIYLLGKLQAHLPKVEEAPHVVASTLAPKPEPLHWQDALVSSLWLLLLGIILPAIAAHLWLSTARDGLVFTLKKIHRVVGRAFTPRPFFIYLVGLFLFGLMPYFILYTRTLVSNGGWVEFSLFDLRLALAFLFTLLGWTITLGALARATPPTETVTVAAPLPAESTTPPTASVVSDSETHEAETHDAAA